MYNSKKGIAYIDNIGVLHVLSKSKSNEKDAKERAKNGIVIEADVEFEGGYPVVMGKKVVIYGIDECYVDGNRSSGFKLNTEKIYPKLAEIYKMLT